MITVAHYLNLPEAQRHKMALDASGIESFIPDELSASIVPTTFMNTTGVRLQVAEADESTARTILEAVPPSHDPLAEE